MNWSHHITYVFCFTNNQEYSIAKFKYRGWGSWFVWDPVSNSRKGDQGLSFSSHSPLTYSIHYQLTSKRSKMLMTVATCCKTDQSSRRLGHIWPNTKHSSQCALGCTEDSNTHWSHFIQLLFLCFKLLVLQQDFDHHFPFNTNCQANAAKCQWQLLPVVRLTKVVDAWGTYGLTRNTAYNGP